MPARPRTEKTRVKEIFAYLATLPRCYFEKTSPGPWAPRGRLDITGALFGFRFEIEVKRDSTEPTKLQAETIARWRKAGAIAFVARDANEVARAFEPILVNICERCKGDGIDGTEPCFYCSGKGLFAFVPIYDAEFYERFARLRALHGHGV
jgi:hypothetical protein